MLVVGSNAFSNAWELSSDRWCGNKFLARNKCWWIHTPSTSTWLLHLNAGSRPVAILRWARLESLQYGNLIKVHECIVSSILPATAWHPFRVQIFPARFSSWSACIYFFTRHDRALEPYHALWKIICMLIGRSLLNLDLLVATFAVWGTWLLFQGVTTLI